MKRLELLDGTTLEGEDLIMLMYSIIQLVSIMEQNGDDVRCPQRYRQLLKITNKGE